jgi:hypothetical protein
MVVSPSILSNGTIGDIIVAGSQNLTGELTATFLLIFFIILIFLIAVRVPLEWVAIIVLPLALSLASYMNNFMVAVVMIVFYLASLVAQKWLFK